jgi:hypothetical protein
MRFLRRRVRRGVLRGADDDMTLPFRGAWRSDRSRIMGEEKERGRLDEAISMLLDEGLGPADGFSVRKAEKVRLAQSVWYSSGELCLAVAEAVCWRKLMSSRVYNHIKWGKNTDVVAMVI